MYLFIYLFIYFYLYLFPYFFSYLPVYLFTCVCNYLFTYLLTYLLTCLLACFLRFKNTKKTLNRKTYCLTLIDHVWRRLRWNWACAGMHAAAGHDRPRSSWRRLRSVLLQIRLHALVVQAVQSRRGSLRRVLGHRRHDVDQSDRAVLRPIRQLQVMNDDATVHCRRRGFSQPICRL